MQKRNCQIIMELTISHFYPSMSFIMHEAAFANWNKLLITVCADLLALLSQVPQSVHDFLSLDSIYKSSAEGWDPHTCHRICQDLHRCDMKILC